MTYIFGCRQSKKYWNEFQGVKYCNCKCWSECNVIFFPNKQLCCDGVWTCAFITIHILNIGGVRYIRNLKIVVSFSEEESSGTNW